MSYYFINAVHQVISGRQPCVYIVDLDEVAEAEHLTFRDMVRTAFTNQGVEIEFSGKGINERGVVIDIDEYKFAELAIDANTLRFGQTVVRVRV